MTGTAPRAADATGPSPSPVPHDLPGLDPSWSRTVTVEDADGVPRAWHYLDNGVEAVHGTVLCVHGNPTWSYLWRGMLAAAPHGWRVVAPDQLGMGYSARTEQPRTVEQRVADLGTLTDALGIDGPVVTLGHDWGGAISLGWAQAHRGQLRGVVTGNTAVAQPPGDLGPPLIRLAHLPGFRPFGCVATPIFVRATSGLSRPALPREVRDALALPYGGAARRTAVGDFVADIPFAEGHPSFPFVDALAEGVRTLDVPALLFWGPRDPVFGERYLADLQDRLPQAQVHRYEGASHLVTEDAPQYAELVAAWLTDLDAAPEHPGPDPAAAVAPSDGPSEGRPDRLWSVLERRVEDRSPAIAAHGTVVSWAALSHRVSELAAGMAATGVRPGDRVGVLVEPSADLTSVVYAAWRAGAVVVVADKGLGFTGMRRALRGASLDHVVGGRTGLAAAAAMGLPGSRIAVGAGRPAVRRLLGAEHDLDELARIGRGTVLPPEPDLDADCAVLFTSGATGPAKGVAYRHRQAAAQVALVRATYDLRPADAFVAAFAPFSLLGPALGLASSLPDIDVTAPDTLTAPLLADAAAAVGATVVFASPAALRRVVATGDQVSRAQRETLGRVRLLMSAGAPVPSALLRAVGEILPAASLHTPYGMTEALPVTDVSLEEITAAGTGEGVCVGRPLAGVTVGIVPLTGPDREPDGLGPVTDAGVTGEICVRAAHVKDRYDALWMTQRASARHPGWHRTGDVGHLDDEGRLWVEGRSAHLISTADGLVTPVGPEQRMEALPAVHAAGLVGIGPEGAQVLAAVVVPATDGPPAPAPRRRGGSLGLRLADHDLAGAVRGAAGVPVAAVLHADRLPLDIRHASKVDRTELARQASDVLAGRR